MVGIGDILDTGKRLKKAGWAGKIGYIIWIIFTISYIVLKYISHLQLVIDFDTRYNVTQRMVSMINLPVISVDYAERILISVSIAIIITAIIFAGVLCYAELRINIEADKRITDIQTSADGLVRQIQEETRQTIEKERNKYDKLQQAFHSLNMAYRKKEGVSENSSTLGMSLSLVKEGSSEHLQGLSHDSLYERAQRLAKEAGLEIKN